MELRHLRYFAAVADALSFTRAAERLHVTQPTLSHQIRQLENELNVALFDRVGKQVRLTEAGEVLRGHMGPALAQIDRGLQALHAAAGTSGQLLRVGTIPSFNLSLMPQCVCTFLSQSTDHRIVVEEMLLDGIVKGLVEERLDLAVSFMPPPDESLWFEPLYKEEFVLITAPNHPLAKRRHVRLVELHQRRMVALQKNLMTRALTDEAMAMAGAEPVVVVQTNTAAAMIDIVQRTDLVGILAERVIPATAPVAVLPLQDPTPIRTPGLMWKRGAMRSSLVRGFADLIRQAATRSTSGSTSKARPPRVTPRKGPTV